MRIRDWSSDVCSSDLDVGVDDDRVLGQCAGGIGCLRGCERGDEGEQQDGQGAVHWGLRRGWKIRGWMNLQEWSGLLLVGAASAASFSRQATEQSNRSEERRGGQESVRTFKSAWTTNTQKK